MWFLYVVKCSDGTLYTGITTDVSRRLHEHNGTKKGAKYTRSRRPVELVYWTDFHDRSAASKAESRFKKLRRSEKLSLLNEVGEYKGVDAHNSDVEDSNTA